MVAPAYMDYVVNGRVAGPMSNRHPLGAAAPILQEPDLFDARHYQERGMFVDVEHPIGFKETIYGSYVKMTGAQPDIQPGPMMGCDNEYVFKELTGISETRYHTLVEDEIIF